MKKRSFKEKFLYWFDNRMARGTVSMIKMLALASVAVVILFTLIIFLCGFGEEGSFLSILWDNLATIINAWMPSSEDGSVGYIILNAIVAIIGLLVTSVLIGIFSTAMEEKIESLRKGNSQVLEEGHTVVLGFSSGEYELLNQLIASAAGRKLCLVVADDAEKDEMEEAIHDNLEVPKNVKIICRHADITDPQALTCCSIDTAKNVIIPPMDDERTVKTYLAVETVLREAGHTADVIGAVSEDHYLLPKVAEKDQASRRITLQVNKLVARILARTCCQPGLSYAFTDLFNYDGSEMYCDDASALVGKTFGELTASMEGGVPVGLEREGQMLLIPDAAETVCEGDRLLYFAEEKTPSFTAKDAAGFNYGSADVAPKAIADMNGAMAVIGYNEVTDTMLRELPASIRTVYFADLSDEEVEELDSLREELNKKLMYLEGNPDRNDLLNQLADKVDHFVLLGEHEDDKDSSDVRNMMRLLKLRAIKKERGLSFSVTTELYRESNRVLVSTNDPTDFIVASDMSAMFLAQLSEKPELAPTFLELISDYGKDLCLVKASQIVEPGEVGTVKELRLKALAQGYAVLGFINHKDDGIEVLLNPPLLGSVSFDGCDDLVVIGEQK